MSDELDSVIGAARRDLERAARYFEAGATGKGLSAIANTAVDLLTAAQDLRASIEDKYQDAARCPGEADISYNQAAQEQAAAAARNLETCTDQLLRLVHVADNVPGFSNITSKTPRERPSVTARKLATRIRGTRLDLPVTAMSPALPGSWHPSVSDVFSHTASCFVTGRNRQARRTAAYAARRLAEIAESAGPASATETAQSPDGATRLVHPREIADAARSLITAPGDGTSADAARQLADSIHASISGQPAEQAAALFDLAASSLDQQDRSPLPAAILADAATSLTGLAATAKKTAARLRRDAAAAAGTGHAAGTDRKARLAQDAADDFAQWAQRANQIRTAYLAEITAPPGLAYAGQSTAPPPRTPAHARTRPRTQGLR